MSESLQKVKTISELGDIARSLRESGKKIVVCHGVFDLLHLGHIRHLSSAKKFGDILIVSVTADKNVRKGPGRPAFNEDLRAEMLANLLVTDYVCINSSSNAVPVLESVLPHYYVKGPDYRNRKSEGSGGLSKEQQAVEAGGGQLVFTDDIAFSSSQLINNYFSVFPQSTTEYLKKLAAITSFDEIESYIKKVRNMDILVIGDAIIDEYHYTVPMGKSSKENIIANKYLSEEHFAGGALATANHIGQISNEVELISVVGETEAADGFVRRQLAKTVTPRFFERVGRQTTRKRRYITKDDGRKIFEVCFIDDQPLSPEEELPVQEYLERKLEEASLVVVNDFGHGLLTKNLRSLVTSKAKSLALNVQTNSANIGFNLVTNYAQADFVCIDEAELRFATRDRYSDVKTLVTRLYNAIGPKVIMVTRGSKGCMAYSCETGFLESPALATNGVDKVGAGDAFFAFTSPCFAAGMPLELLAFVGNAVGALKLQIVGNREPVRWPDLLKFMTCLLKQ